MTGVRVRNASDKQLRATIDDARRKGWTDYQVGVLLELVEYVIELRRVRDHD